MCRRWLKTSGVNSVKRTLKRLCIMTENLTSKSGLNKDSIDRNNETDDTYGGKRTKTRAHRASALLFCFRLTSYDFDADPLRIVLGPNLHGLGIFRHELTVTVHNENLRIPTLLRHFRGF